MSAFSFDHCAPRILVRYDTHIEKGGLGYTILGTNVDGDLLTVLAKPGEPMVTREQLNSSPEMRYALEESAVILTLLLGSHKNPYKVPLEDFLVLYNTLLTNPRDKKKAEEIESWLKEKISSGSV